MDTFFLILFFLIGLIFGSFFNVVGLRLPKNKSFSKGRSHCTNCHKQLVWYELIPVISYVFQHGRCRGCSGKISLIYPLIEVVTGLLFALSFYVFKFDIEFITALLLISILMIIFVTDLTYMIIPNKVMLFFLPFFIIIRIIQPLHPWWSSLLGAGIAFLLIAMIILISKGGMGGGDLKLFTLLGFILGIKQVMLIFLLSCLIGALLGVLLMALGKLKRKEPMPFGPFIVIATLFTYFLGDFVINWYLDFFV